MLLVASPATFLLIAALYGFGVLFARELVVGWGGGWASMLALGAAFGVLEEGLGRDAAAEKAGAADLRVLLDDRHFHPELPGADARDVAARSAADDD